MLTIGVPVAAMQTLATSPVAAAEITSSVEVVMKSTNPSHKRAAVIPMARLSMEATGLPVQDLQMCAMKQELRIEPLRSVVMGMSSTNNSREPVAVIPMAPCVSIKPAVVIRNATAASVHPKLAHVVSRESAVNQVSASGLGFDARRPSLNRPWDTWLAEHLLNETLQ